MPDLYGDKIMRELTLGEIRKQHRVKQEVVAMALCVTASGVSKLESKRIQDVPLHRAAAYLAAVGGSLKIEVTLPDGGTMSMGENAVA